MFFYRSGYSIPVWRVGDAHHSLCCDETQKRAGNIERSCSIKLYSLSRHGPGLKAGTTIMSFAWSFAPLVLYRQPQRQITKPIALLRWLHHRREDQGSLSQPANGRAQSSFRSLQLMQARSSRALLEHLLPPPTFKSSRARKLQCLPLRAVLGVTQYNAFVF